MKTINLKGVLISALCVACTDKVKQPIQNQDEKREQTQEQGEAELPKETGISPVSAPEIVSTFFENHLPKSDYSLTSPVEFHFGIIEPMNSVCFLINETNQFKDIAPQSAELPVIDFEKYTLVIALLSMGNPGYRISTQNIDVDHDIMKLNLEYASLGGVSPSVITTFYCWGLYPKLPEKAITVNVDIKYPI